MHINLINTAIRALQMLVASVLAASATSYAYQLPSDLDSYEDLSINSASVDSGRGDVPVNVTVITRQELQVLGITDIVDALRLVPGMSVAKQSASRASAGYHGTNPVVPRRLAVLVDGMSISLVSGSTVYWNAFPVSVEDIERIEIVRNPNMPINGAHSFQSTINFITRHPADDMSNELIISGDTNGFDKQSLRLHGSVSDTSLAIRFENTENSGLDIEVNRTSNGITKQPAFDGQHDKKINFSSSTQISDQVELRLLAGTMDAQIQRKSNDVNAIGLNDEGFESSFFNGILHYNDSVNDLWTLQTSFKTFDVNRSWETCYPKFMFLDELREMHLANPQYAATLLAGKMPSGGSASDNALAVAALTKFMSMGASALQPQCGSVNENFNEGQGVLSLENVHTVSENLKFISGVEYEHSEYESQTIIGGKADMASISAYTSGEYRLTPFWTATLGTLYNYDDLNKESNTALLAGVSFNFAPSHTAKITYTDSFRSPGVVEKKFYWSYLMSNFSNPMDGTESGLFYRVTQNPYASQLSNESLQSFEISFDGNILSGRADYNVRVFKERLRDLISQDINFNVVELNNENATDLEGVEGEVHFRLSHNWKLSAAYSYIDNESTHVNETILFYPHSGYAKIIYATGDYSAALIYYSAHNDYRSFDRIEATFGRNYIFGSREVFWQAKINSQNNDFTYSSGQISASGADRYDAAGWLSYENDWNLGLKAGIRF